MNLSDAMVASAESQKEALEEQEGDGDGGADRLSILQHIYTRCQEEVEKSVPPGVALLNKVLRTEQQEEIRTNQLSHYLCPQPDVIKLPDGQEIPVKDGERNKILVPHEDFIQAIGNFHVCVFFIIP